jgi:hypothetical protein
MAARGITLVRVVRLAFFFFPPEILLTSYPLCLQFFVACEPALSSYSVRPRSLVSCHPS